MNAPNVYNDQKWMRLALDEAEAALKDGEFPVGCVIVGEKGEICRARRAASKGLAPSELDHAEILALRKLTAQKASIVTPLTGLTIYSTLEPCLMCFGAILIHGIERIVFAYEDVMGGACGLTLSKPLSSCGDRLSQVGIMERLYQPQHVKIEGGVMRNEALRLFKEFFASENASYLSSTWLARYTIEAS